MISKRLEIQDGAPNRKVYTITEAGKRAFLETLRSPLAQEQPKSAIFDARLFFFAHLSPEERRAIVVNYLDFVEQVHTCMESARPEIEARADRFQYQCFQFGLRFFSDLTRNLSQVMDALEEEQKESL